MRLRIYIVGVHRNHADKHIPAGRCPDMLNAYDHFHDKSRVDAGFTLTVGLRAMEIYQVGVASNRPGVHIPQHRCPNILSSVAEQWDGHGNVLYVAAERAMDLYYAGVAPNHAQTHVPAGRTPNVLNTILDWFNGDKRLLYILEQRMIAKQQDPEEPGCVESHFLDSGSFSLKTKAKEYAEANGCSEWDFYDTDAHWEYLDSYAKFIKKFQIGIDFYANVDAIPNPEISWRNQKYLEEKHGLTPVPVVHCGTDLKWLRRYIKAGYKYIALGGLVGKTKKESTIRWIDRCFDMVCDNPQRLPSVDLHGFGITNYELLVRYPWRSVDSASWTKVAAFGGILVPRKQQAQVGQYDFRHEPYILKVSDVSPDLKTRNHVFTVGKHTREKIDGWLEEIGVALGKSSPEGEVIEEGVVNSYNCRQAANLMFFEALRKSLPDYPWPFTIRPMRTFEL